jgi:ABC-type molybdenum transport system ATPase subunit/photorepair protein PhrA
VLVPEPSVVVLDEPLAGLAGRRPVTEADFASVLGDRAPADRSPLSTDGADHGTN